ncbi:protein NRT1/ PTR FAMILY 5.7-like [Salvia hispanica]|uniref:protein NRT1/ PTR FAMILY 5.7-like n=1 Tax=Salvia hispanica TaxID=49212 RepID=UPI0020095492|nr:protein NRT1/ PTR FAMILY 5.7-like [Salvia hispanica]
MKLNQVLPWCREKFRYYVVFTTSIFFILGLIFSYKLVEKTFLNILMTRLAEAWEGDNFDLRTVVIIVNLHEGTAAVLVLLFVYAADVMHHGRFKTVVFSTAVCIIGLMLNKRAARDDETLSMRLFYPALGLLALALAAQRVNLEGFLDDQLRPKGLEDDRRKRRSKFWWTLVSFAAAIFAGFGPLPRLHFEDLALTLISVMGFCFFVFLLAFKRYHFVPEIENPFKDVGIVIHGAISNRNIEWLDKAAAEGSCSSEQVRGVKLLFKMLPLWCCFLTFSLVSASGSTFFFNEAMYLTTDHNYINAILLFSNLSRLTQYVVSYASSFLIGKLEDWKKCNRQKMELVRIGTGMICCLLCCIIASETARRRQDIGEYDFSNDNMSTYWLTPQYFLLGMMWGLSEDGFESFYESQVSENLSKYGVPFMALANGVGIFASILCILVLRSPPFEWFKKELYYSSLDKYYIFLAVLSVVNLLVYCWVAYSYGVVGDAKTDQVIPGQSTDTRTHPEEAGPGNIEGGGAYGDHMKTWEEIVDQK